MSEQKVAKVPTMKDMETDLKIAILEDFTVVLTNIIFTTTKIKDLPYDNKKDILNDLIDAWKKKLTTEKSRSIKSQLKKLLETDETIEKDVGQVLIDSLFIPHDMIKDEVVENIRSYLLSSLKPTSFK